MRITEPAVRGAGAWIARAARWIPAQRVALAQHGFDLGIAWIGESTDSMHMELIVPRGG